MAEIAIVVAIVGAVQKIYSTYQQAIGFLEGSGPSVDDEILQLVQAMTQELNEIAQALSQLQKLAIAGLEETEQAAINEIVQAVQMQASAAQAAAEDYAEWLKGGKPGVGTPAVQNQPAWQTSLTAATTMRDTTEYFEKPVADPSTGVVTNQFDYRLALAQYVYVLSVRLTVIMGMEPNWASDDIIRQELGQHAQRLVQITSSMTGAISFESKTWGPPEENPNTFGVDGTCTDTISGYSTGQWTGPLLQGTAADAAAYTDWLRIYLVTEVQNAIGVTTVIQFASLVTWYSNGAPGTGTWIPWSAITTVIAPSAQSVSSGLWPLAAVSSEPSGVTVVWGTRGAVSTIAYTAAGGWGPQSQIPGSESAGSPLVPEWGPWVVVASCATGNVCVFWTATDGSIQGSYYDAPATNAAWSQAFRILAGVDGIVPAAPTLLGAVSSSPGSVTVFYSTPSDDYKSVWATSFTVDTETAGRSTVVSKSALTPTVVSKSALTPPVATGAVTPPGVPAQFVALSSGEGSISLVYMTGEAVASTYYDNRASAPAWATPFVIAANVTSLVGLAAVSRSPYEVDVYWTGGAAGVVPVSTSSFTLEVRADNPLRGLVRQVVTPTAPAPVAPVPQTASYLAAQVIPPRGLTAVATAPVPEGAPPAGATAIFWMADGQTVRMVSSSAPAGWSDVTVIGAPLGTQFGPIVAVESAPGDISLFAIVPQSNDQGSEGAYVVETARWQTGKPPLIPFKPRLPVV